MDALQLIPSGLAAIASAAACFSTWQNRGIELAIAGLKADLIERQQVELQPLRDRVTKVEYTLEYVLKAGSK